LAFITRTSRNSPKTYPNPSWNQLVIMVGEYTALWLSAGEEVVDENGWDCLDYLAFSILISLQSSFFYTFLRTILQFPTPFRSLNGCHHHQNFATRFRRSYPHHSGQIIRFRTIPTMMKLTVFCSWFVRTNCPFILYVSSKTISQ
jgi:hypothetical protein